MTTIYTRVGGNIMEIIHNYCKENNCEQMGLEINTLIEPHCINHYETEMANKPKEINNDNGRIPTKNARRI